MLKHWIWLAERKGLGSRARLALLRRFGSPEDIYYADPEELLLTEGVAAEDAAALEDKDLSAAEEALSACQRLDIQLLTLQDAAYPDRLKNIYDPPCLLYYRGRLPALDEEAAVAVVGTRACTPYGIASAEKLGYGIAKGGGVVVSGLAKGIDAAALRGALRAGGLAVGVVGNGLDVVYPRENRYLYEDVAAAGVLISEYPPGTEPAASHFPARNRILSGLCVAALVVEAPERSGAMITAADALEQGRDVFAVPGPIDAPSSAGCNRLIREGAGLVSDPWDLLAEYEGRFPGKLHREGRAAEGAATGYHMGQSTEAKAVLPTLHLADAPQLTEEQVALLRSLDTEEGALPDDLVERTGLAAPRLLAALTLLEVGELVRQIGGGRYIRTVTLAE